MSNFRFSIWVYYLFLFAFWQEEVKATDSISVIDASASRVQLKTPAKRIIGLAPHIVENVFAAGAGDFLVGVSAYSNYPEAAKEIPVVGDAFGFNLEAILELKPDLVIAWSSGVNPKLLSQLKSFGIPVYLDEPKTLEDIAVSITHFSQLAGTIDQGQKAVAGYKRRLQSLRNNFKGKKPVSVFYQIWYKPLQTVGNSHLISDVMRLCGGNNSFSDSPLLAPRVSIETILQKNPDVILGSDSGKAYSLKKQWQAWSQINAVKNQHIYFIPGDILLRHSTRILQGAEMMCATLEEVRASLK